MSRLSVIRGWTNTAGADTPNGSSATTPQFQQTHNAALEVHTHTHKYSCTLTHARTQKAPCDFVSRSLNTKTSQEACDLSRNVAKMCGLANLGYGRQTRALAPKPQQSSSLTSTQGFFNT